jgi:glycine hydroxymethyltransferase
MEWVVDCIDRVIVQADDAQAIATIRKQVNEFMSQFPLYPELG